MQSAARAQKEEAKTNAAEAAATDGKVLNRGRGGAAQTSSHVVASPRRRVSMQLVQQCQGLIERCMQQYIPQVSAPHAMPPSSAGFSDGPGSDAPP